MYIEVFSDPLLKDGYEITIKLLGKREVRVFETILEHAAHDFKGFTIGAVPSLQEAVKMLNELRASLY